MGFCTGFPPIAASGCRSKNSEKRIHLFEVANLGYLVGSWLEQPCFLVEGAKSFLEMEFYGRWAQLWLFFASRKKTEGPFVFSSFGGWLEMRHVNIDSSVFARESWSSDIYLTSDNKIWQSIWKRNLTIVGHLFDFILHLLTFVSAVSDSRFGFRRLCESKNWATSYIEFVRGVLTSNK